MSNRRNSPIIAEPYAANTCDPAFELHTVRRGASIRHLLKTAAVIMAICGLAPAIAHADAVDDFLETAHREGTSPPGVHAMWDALTPDQQHTVINAKPSLVEELLGHMPAQLVVPQTTPVAKVGTAAATSLPLPVIPANFAAIDASQNSARLDALQSQQDDDRKSMKSGVSNALAISGLHYVDTNNSMALGAGSYQGGSAIALGYRHKFAENVATTIAASQDNNSGTGVAGSFAVGW
ncbi:YadA C-terminal domain-containing protein [Yersinia sp. Marseille-Q3913]|uniref:YadA C-terminal domain-containing protein n=1 Tax=Yersinia sp. Marseille-Q3913 TaxID=2830769 RepID=UPI001BAFD700|nr:YadA C-terminal domain-containing protein [Yersinia sp. Marseille-Q3913]MBS0054468.1 YadA C-terminal domain-containing protein [Yersinia sp. Marseille-Q3913]